MRKFGIILLGIGIIQMIVQIISFVQGKGFDNEFFITSCGILTFGIIFFVSGNYLKTKAKKKPKLMKR